MPKFQQHKKQQTFDCLFFIQIFSIISPKIHGNINICTMIKTHDSKSVYITNWEVSHMKTRKFQLKALSSVIITIISTHIYAQDTTNLERIEITAQKRTQNIQEVPVSVSAFTGEQLTKNHVTSLVDASEMMPNVEISSTSSMPQIYMRGIGAGINYGFEQSVAQFRDNIYIGRAIMARSPVFDIERVEVLKGAQSIMFGKNATAGVISTMTKNAINDTEGMFSASYGSYSTLNIEGMFNTAISDNWSARIAGVIKTTNGFTKNNLDNNQIRGVDHIDGQENSGVRLSLQGELDNGLSIGIKVEHSESDFELSSRQYYVDNSALAAAIDKGHSAGLTALLDPKAIIDKRVEFDDTVGDQSPFNDNLESDTAVLTLEYDLNNNALTSITTYQDYTWNNAYDPTYSAQNWVALDRTENFDQLTQELRFVTPEAEIGELDYIVGVYYTRQNLDLNQNADMYQFPSVPIPDSRYGLFSDFAIDEWSIAAFTSVGWQVNEKLKLDLGVRFDKENKTVTSLQKTYTADFGIPEANALGLADTILAAFGAGNHLLNEDRDETHLSPSLKMSYQENKNLMYYASATVGNKGGGFDGTLLNNTGIMGTSSASGDAYNHFNPAVTPSDSFEYEDEKATAFEIGLKSDILDGKGRINIVYYYTKFENMQVSAWDGQSYVVDNAAKSIVQGFETDFTFILNDYWFLSGSAAYLDFEYDSFENGVATVWQDKVEGLRGQDLTGKRGVYAPEVTASLSINYEDELSQAILLSSNLFVNYSSEFYTASDLDEQSKQDSFAKLNFRLGLSDSADGKWSVAFLAKNITDEQVIRTSQDLPGNAFAYWVSIDPPRTYTITGTYSF